MRPTTRWERFKRSFIWGSWPWSTFLIKRYEDETLVVVGKLKVKVPRRFVSRGQS